MGVPEALLTSYEGTIQRQNNYGPSSLGDFGG